MFTLRFAAPLLLALSLLAPFGAAQTCAGDPGFELEINPPVVPIGSLFEECLRTPPGTWTAFMIVSLDTGSVSTKAGNLCVVPPFLAIIDAPIPPNGELCLSDRQMPCSPEFITGSSWPCPIRCP